MGQDWRRRIEENVKSCALFLPVMSRETAAQRRDAYFRVEWNRANERTERMAPGEVFITPLVIDDLPRAEAQEEFTGVHIERAPAGELGAAVIESLAHAYARATSIQRGDGR